MRGLLVTACALLGLQAGLVALAAETDEDDWLSEDRAPVIKSIKKPVAPTPTPEPPALNIPLQPQPFQALNPFRLLPGGTSGEVQVQQGGTVFGSGAQQPQTTGSSRMGLSLRSQQGDNLWSWSSMADRQDSQWLLGDFSLVGYFGSHSHLTLGDETVSLGNLLMDNLSLRGGHLQTVLSGWKGRVFVGGDRPALNTSINDRTLGGLETELPVGDQSITTRARLVAQDDRTQRQRGAAASLGGTYDRDGATVEGELAASMGEAPVDMGMLLSANIPWDRFQLGGRFMHQGSNFQVIRGTTMPREGGRQDWDAFLNADLGNFWRSSLRLGNRQLNLAGLEDLPRQQARLGSLSLGYVPREGLTGSLSYSRSQNSQSYRTSDFETLHDRVSTELSFKLPFASQSRARWEWWNIHSGTSSQVSQQVGLQAGRLFETPLSLNQIVTLNQGSPNRLYQGLRWSGTLWNRSLQGSAEVFLDHELERLMLDSNRVGVGGDLGTPLNETDNLEIVGYWDRNFGGSYSTARWMARYVSRFGGHSAAKAGERITRIAGRVELAPGVAGIGAGDMVVWLDKVQKGTLQADGSFAFENMRPGRHTVSLDTSRLPIGVTVAASQVSQDVTLNAGQQIDGLRFVVGPSHQVSGTVRDQDGKPVSSVSIILEGDGRKETWTDAAGRYLFDTVAGGKYRVRLAPAPEGADFTWDDLEIPLLLQGGTPRQGIDFVIQERRGPVTTVTLSEEAFEFEAPPPPEKPPEGIAETAGAQAVLLPNPVVPGKPATLKVRTVGLVSQVSARLGTAPWKRLKKEGNGIWSTTFTVPPRAPSAYGRATITVTRPRKAESLSLDFQVAQRALHEELVPPQPLGSLVEIGVKPGDTLSQIALRELGSGLAWEELYELNRETIGPNPSWVIAGDRLKLPLTWYTIKPGDTLLGIATRELPGKHAYSRFLVVNPGLARSSRVRIGDRVRLPLPTHDQIAVAPPSQATPMPETKPPIAKLPAMTPPAVPPAPSQPGAAMPRQAADDLAYYRVQPGDSLSLIAWRIFGDASMWPRLVDPGQDKAVRLVSGQRIRFPVPFEAYTVKEGESLTKIAYQTWKNPSLWWMLYRMNQDRIGPNPTLLRPRTLIRIPRLPEASPSMSPLGLPASGSIEALPSSQPSR